MKKDNFTLLKDEIKNTIEKRDSALLKQYNKKVSKNDKVKNITELENKFTNFMNLLGIESDATNNVDYDALLKEKIVDSYEEEKSGVTFGILLEKNKNKLIVSLLIFDTEETYSNLLVKTYDIDDLTEAKIYFNELKDLVIKNNLDNLSKLILEKM
ncbi:MAG: hypothetical protein J6B98_01175 [Bacilli bacterium]|nr:hypothetical protein [Bacilli bacterium]